MRKHCALLCLIVLFLYGRNLGADFLIWDDDTNIYHNPIMRQPVGFALDYFWHHAYYALYVPISYSLWTFLAKAGMAISGLHPRFGIQPLYFHSLNIVLHAINTCLVYKLLVDLNADPRQIATKRTKKLKIQEVPAPHPQAAIIASALFALHPLQTEAVAWASGMRDVLSFCFGTLAILLYWRRDNNTRAYMLATLCFACGVLAKPGVIVVPLIIIVLSYFYRDGAWRKEILPLAPWALFSAVIVYFARDLQPISKQAFIAPLWTRPLLFADALRFYATKLLLPWPLTPIYGRTPASVIDSSALWISAGFCAAAVAALWYKRQTLRWLIGAVCCIAVALLPVSGLVTFGFQDISGVADRYMYLPMLGVALAVFFALTHINKPLFNRAVLALLPLFAVITWHQVGYWNNSLSLFEHALAVLPHNAMTNNQVGVALAGLDRYEAALPYYETALQINPKYEEAWTNVGNAYVKLSRYQDTVTHYKKMFKLGIDTASARNIYGIALIAVGRKPEGLEQLRASIKKDPNFIDARLNLGQHLYVDGQREEAREHLQYALALDPNNAIARQFLSYYDH